MEEQFSNIRQDAYRISSHAIALMHIAIASNDADTYVIFARRRLTIQWRQIVSVEARLNRCSHDDSACRRQNVEVVLSLCCFVDEVLSLRSFLPEAVGPTAYVRGMRGLDMTSTAMPDNRCWHKRRTHFLLWSMLEVVL